MPVYSAAAPPLLLAAAESFGVPDSPTAWVVAAWLVVFVLKWVREERKEASSDSSPSKIAASRALHHRETTVIGTTVERIENTQSDRAREDALRNQETLNVLKQIKGGIDDLVRKAG